MFYSLNGLVKSDTGMSLRGAPGGRNYGPVQKNTESNIVSCEMENGWLAKTQCLWCEKVSSGKNGMDGH